MNLYEINGQVMQLTEMLENGEIDETVYNDTVESLGGQIAIEDVIKSIRNKQAEIEALKAESDRLTEKRRNCENAVEGLKNVLLTYLKITNQKKLKTELFSVTQAASKSVSITDESIIPAKYLIPQPAKLDKKAILAELKAGEIVEGATLTENEYLMIK